MNKIQIQKKEIRITFNVVIGSRVYQFNLIYKGNRLDGKIVNMTRLNRSLKPNEDLENVVDTSQMESELESLGLPLLSLELIEDLCRIYSEDEPLSPFRVIDYGDDFRFAQCILAERVYVYFPPRASFISFSIFD